MVKGHFSAILIVIFSILFMIGNVQGLYELNGWTLPTESGDHNKYVGFGAHYKPGGVPSIHLGQDFEGDTRNPVYALADGEVIESRADVSGYGPWGTKGGALIALFTTSEGLQFKALYGHINNPHSKGIIKAGDILGYINGYDPPHLHFGIHPGINYPSNPWRGFVTEAEYAKNGDTYGWVDPIEFLEMHGPIASTSQKVTLTLYVRDGSASGPVIPGAQVIGHDASANSFQQTTDSSGYVTIEGDRGTWSFSASADGYETNSWSQPITSNCTKHAFLMKSAAPTAAQDSESCPETCNDYSNNCLALLGDNNEAFKCYKSAATCFENAVQQNPNNAECWYHLGNALHNSGNQLQGIRGRYDDANEMSQFDDAIKALDRATELDPQLNYAWNEKGVIYEQQGNFGEAIKCYDKAIEIDPSWSVPRKNKAELGRF